MLTDMLKIFKFKIPPEVKFDLKNVAKSNKSYIEIVSEKYKYVYKSWCPFDMILRKTKNYIPIVDIYSYQHSTLCPHT